MCLNAVAVVVLLVDAARLVRVEEVLVVVLVRLPLGESVADSEGHAAEDEEERVVVDAEGLRRRVRGGAAREWWLHGGMLKQAQDVAQAGPTRHARRQGSARALR